MPSGAKKVFVTRLTDTSLTDQEGLNTLRWEGNKCYKWVLYAEGTAALDIVAGDALGYLADGYDLGTVVSDITDMDAQCIPAGNAMATVTVTATYMWIQIKGAATASITHNGTTPAQGDTLFLLTTDKTWTVDPTVNTRAGGILQKVSSKEMVLDCPF